MNCLSSKFYNLLGKTRYTSYPSTVQHPTCKEIINADLTHNTRSVFHEVGGTDAKCRREGSLPRELGF